MNTKQANLLARRVLNDKSVVWQVDEREGTIFTHYEGHYIAFSEDEDSDDGISHDAEFLIDQEYHEWS